METDLCTDRAPYRHGLLTEAIQIATLAPSNHNTQPWRFRVRGDAIDLFADRARSLPIADPDGRELTLSCGAALFYLRLAIAHMGFRPLVTLTPDARDPDRLATVTFGEPAALPYAEFELFAAIPRRRTDRRPFAQTLIPVGLPVQLQRDAGAEGAWLHVVAADVHDTLLDLTEEGDRVLWANDAYRRELADWIRPGESTDGHADHYHHGLGPAVVRIFDLGEREAKRNRALATGSPMLAVIGTRTNTPVDWLRAGQALARVLLRAASTGVGASFLNQSVQVAELRPKLARSLSRAGEYPQLVLRMGQGSLLEPTARRPLTEVLAG